MHRYKILFGILCVAIGGILFFSTCSNGQKHHKDAGASLNCYYEQHQLYRGAQGGCFYYNKAKEKKYVPKKYCNCN